MEKVREVFDMSLVLAANSVAAELTAKIRGRIAEGVSVQETSLENLPDWFAAHVGDAAVEAVFESEYALVAVLQDGSRIVRHNAN